MLPACRSYPIRIRLGLGQKCKVLCPPRDCAVLCHPGGSLPLTEAGHKPQPHGALSPPPFLSPAPLRQASLLSASSPKTGNHRVCPALQKGPGQHEALSLQTADSASLHGHLGTPSDIHIKLFFTREQRREGCASRAQRLGRQLRTAPDYESQRTKRTVARIRSRLNFPLTCKEVQSRVNTAAPPPPTTQAPLACSPPPLT